MSKMFMYHKEKAPEGFMFDVKEVEDNKEAMEAEGWVDTPKGFNLPPKMVEISEKKSKTLKPDELIGLVRGMGFLVMSKEEFEAEKVKAVQLSQIPIPSAPANDKTPEQIIEQFENDPESLTKEELIEYGNEVFDLGLTRSMKEATLISKIQEARG